MTPRPTHLRFVHAVPVWWVRQDGVQCAGDISPTKRCQRCAAVCPLNMRSSVRDNCPRGSSAPATVHLPADIVSSRQHMHRTPITRNRPDHDHGPEPTWTPDSVHRSTCASRRQEPRPAPSGPGRTGQKGGGRPRPGRRCRSCGRRTLTWWRVWDEGCTGEDEKGWVGRDREGCGCGDAVRWHEIERDRLNFAVTEGGGGSPLKRWCWNSTMLSSVYLCVILPVAASAPTHPTQLVKTYTAIVEAHDISPFTLARQALAARHHGKGEIEQPGGRVP